MDIEWSILTKSTQHRFEEDMWKDVSDLHNAEDLVREYEARRNVRAASRKATRQFAEGSRRSRRLSDMRRN